MDINKEMRGEQISSGGAESTPGGEMDASTNANYDDGISS